MKNIFSHDFLEELKQGQKEFDNINLQYCDIPKNDFRNVVIRNSRLFFVNFNECDFAGAKFINCELVYVGFYYGTLENALFEKCFLEYDAVEFTTFKNTKFVKSNLRWSTFFSVITGEMDVQTSIQYKFFTAPEQITQKDVDEALILLGQVFDKLDITIRAKVKAALERDIKRYGFDVPKDQEKKSNYEHKSASGYGMKQISDIVISAYNAANPYKSDIGYKTDNKQYKS